MFWSLVVVLVLLPTMLWDARLLGLRLATARKIEGDPVSGAAPRTPVRRSGLRRAAPRLAVLRSAERPATPAVPEARMTPVHAVGDPRFEAPPDQPPVILPVSGPGGPVDVLAGGPGDQFPQITPLGPGGPVTYPVGQPPGGPPTTPPVTVAPVTPTPDPSEPPVITPVDPEDQPPTLVDPEGPPPIDPVDPLDPDLPIRPLDPQLPPVSPPAPVPEPSGWLLMIFGAGLSGAALRRRAQYGRPHAG